MQGLTATTRHVVTMQHLHLRGEKFEKWTHIFSR